MKGLGFSFLLTKEALLHLLGSDKKPDGPAEESCTLTKRIYLSAWNLQVFCAVSISGCRVVGLASLKARARAGKARQRQQRLWCLHDTDFADIPRIKGFEIIKTITFDLK
ncbi:hypothetical protein H1C71_028484 [Ictidomys tridecemlineatus]|nr:hypothetical protein H1C71_028483 [Ictidomys tridecemlineatus]KAG3258797.1 hypothetical protein H1C71_028484 [Ictidomys tridecemlineatus]KAG3258798.1 hypothetical protein H1C71_028484 [Ictidomys tridecemlineatus]